MIQYTCCFCGALKDATHADIEQAHAASRDNRPTEPVFYTDQDAFRDYGRDICPECAVRSLLLTFDRPSTVVTLTKHGARIS